MQKLTETVEVSYVKVCYCHEGSASFDMTQKISFKYLLKRQSDHLFHVCYFLPLTFQFATIHFFVFIISSILRLHLHSG